MKTDQPNESLVQQVQNRAVMTEAMSSRSVQEVQAALVVAKRFPRDEFTAIEKIKTACKRRGLAEMAEYEYSRGGTKITGPTIDLLKAIAKRWGNLDFGWQELERKDGESSVRAFAWDMESNARMEMIFTVRHWRDTKQGGYALTDERDIYEATANFASRRVRACLESLVDGDVIQMAQEQCRLTLKGDGKVPLIDRARQMVAAFAPLGVTVPMIETLLGNKLDAISENQYAKMFRIHKSLKDGVGEVADFFKGEPLVKVEGEPDVPPADGGNQEAPTEKPTVHVMPDAKAKPEPKSTIGVIQDSLAAFWTDAKCTFDDFKRFLAEDYWDPKTCASSGMDSWPDFSAVPTQLARTLMRATKGMSECIAEMKGGVK